MSCRLAPERNKKAEGRANALECGSVSDRITLIGHLNADEARALQLQSALCGDMAVDNMRGKKRNLVLFMLVLVCLVLWGARELLFSGSAGLESKFAPDRAYSGRIVVSVVERMTGPEKNLQFLIDLNRGDISRSEKTKIEVHANPRGRIDDCQREGSVALSDG